MIDELLNPQVPWEDQLREFVVQSMIGKDVSSWRKINRRFIGNDIYFPSLIGETVKSLAILIDTSGSIGRDELTLAMSEIKAITELVSPERIDVVYWDHAIAGHEVYEGSAVADLVARSVPRGGGGTNIEVGMNFLNKEHIKPDCIINITDGYVGSDWGHEWPAPIMFVIVNNPGCTAPVGKTIHINGE